MAVLNTHADSNAIYAKKCLIIMVIVIKTHTGRVIHTRLNGCNKGCVQSDNLKISTLETIVINQNYVRTDLLNSR